MEIDSLEHKRLLNRSIWKMAAKTSLVGIIIGVALMIPSLLRENSFSTGLAFLGQAVSIIAVCYAFVIALKKQAMIKKSLSKF